MKKTLKIIGVLLLALILIAACYVAYVFLSFGRIPDNQELEIARLGEVSEERLKIGAGYTAVSYNIGFGAYLPEFSFFMDGGESSWAKSKESVIETVSAACEFVASLEPDFALIQEIDIDATRSYHVDQLELFNAGFVNHDLVFAINYDSPFLMYPLTRPHGASKSGIATYSSYAVTSSLRRSFPISTGISKVLDLDRCYTISRVAVENGKELVIFNLHMSAYGNSDDVREGQVSMLCTDMKKEYEAGNYVLCGGDFNHNLKALVEASEAVLSWAYPFPREGLGEHLMFAIDLFSEEEKAAMWDSCRNADVPYKPESSFVVTVDGFIVSDNIEVVGYENINTGYKLSDHEPVKITFVLK
ncbi:MAG TPA: endonuclease/exonuclease/phosphatase family protein [Bacillota bacterium]|nr:endonuclease/exonuclease/phosphatase family protein [Bacillota bacterium]